MTEYLSLALNVVLLLTATAQSWVILSFWQRQGYMPPPVKVPQGLSGPPPQKLPDNVDLTAYKAVSGADDSVTGIDEPPVF